VGTAVEIHRIRTRGGADWPAVHLSDRSIPGDKYHHLYFAASLIMGWNFLVFEG
jgi:hypothetical protein